MASFTASGWPSGATVEAYGTDAFGQKSGAAITSGTASAAGQVTFNHAGLVEGGRYVATDGSRSTNFKVPINRTPAPGPSITALTADMAAITASTTLVPITGLAVPIGASATEIWLLKYWMLVQADNAVMDAKFGMNNNPAGAVVRWGGIVGSGGTPAGWGAPVTATAGVTALATGSTISVGTAGGPTAPAGIGFVAVVYGGGTAGNVQIQVAQATSDAGALQILKGSMVEATKVAA